MIFKPSLLTSHLKFCDKIGIKWFRNKKIWNKYTIDIEQMHFSQLVDFAYELEKQGKRSN